MPTIRAFIAIPLPENLATEFASLQSHLIASDAQVKWDTPDKFHITLKFLGDTESSQIDSIASELQKSICTLPGFDISYATVGAFPTISRPRVIWVGTEENEHIPRLLGIVEGVCSSFGFAKEDRPFHAHITLGRVKGTRNLDRLTAIAKSITFKPLIARCSEVHVMRSELKPTGSIYTLLNSIPLAP
jgi:2'-5' RNA ligase